MFAYALGTIFMYNLIVFALKFDIICIFELSPYISLINGFFLNIYSSTMEQEHRAYDTPYSQSQLNLNHPGFLVEGSRTVLLGPCSCHWLIFIFHFNVFYNIFLHLVFIFWLVITHITFKCVFHIFHPSLFIPKL